LLSAKPERKRQKQEYANFKPEETKSVLGIEGGNHGNYHWVVFTVTVNVAGDPILQSTH